MDYDSHGINNSHCLLIKSNSTKSWSYSHNKYVEVSEGDVFNFEGFAKIQGDKISAYAGIAAFDKYKNPIKWNYISKKVDKTEKWIKVKIQIRYTQRYQLYMFQVNRSWYRRI